MDTDVDTMELLQVRAIFGGAQIVVPETWRVSTRVVGLGGIGDGRPVSNETIRRRT